MSPTSATAKTSTARLIVIAVIACRMGLLVSRDARSVGANTTSTVVQCIVWVIVIDAAFAVLLQQLGI